MSSPILPVDAVQGDDRHRVVRAEVFAVVPQHRATMGKRAFWSAVLFVARFPKGLSLLRRLRGS
jgi:hypothetical protein